MDNLIVLKKLALNIRTDYHAYILVCNNPFYQIKWSYMYKEYDVLPTLEFVSVLIEPYESELSFLRYNSDNEKYFKKIKYPFHYQFFGCDFFQNKKLYSPVPEFLFDEVSPQKISNIDYLTGLIYQNHKKIMALESNTLGLNIIPKKIIKSILF